MTADEPGTTGGGETPGGSLPRLMLVTDRHRVGRRELLHQVSEAARGGVGLVQVREKDLPDDELRDLVRRVRAAVPGGTRVAVNGSLRVARTTGAGLHLPAAAPSPGNLRPDLLGRSVHDEAEAQAAREEGVSYVVAGPIHPTDSKPGHPGAGLALIERIAGVVDPIPVFAIGGFSVANAAPAIRAGAHGIAVCGLLMRAPDARRVAEGLNLAISVALGPR